MSDLPRHVIRLADLPTRRRAAFTLEPDAPARAAIAASLGVLGLPKLRFSGALLPMGKRDWRLEAAMGATVQQACVVTLEPVSSRIDEQVARSYVAEIEVPDADEIEMPEDDTTDPLPETLDLYEVLSEALALALPPYPRKEDAQTGTAVFTEPGKAPMRDEDARPFAGLAGLRDAITQDANTQDANTQGEDDGDDGTEEDENGGSSA